MLKLNHTEIYTLEQSSPYPIEGGERHLRRRTNDLRSSLDAQYGQRSWLKLIKKNKTQQKSIFGGLLVFLGTSIHILWGHWRLEVLASWKQLPNRFTLHFTMCAWYLGCICGTLLCVVLSSVWTKKQLYYLSGSVLSLSGVMFIIWHDLFPALLAGRVLAGISGGVVFLTLLIHAAENTVKEIRGFVICSISLLRAISTFLASLLFIIPYYNPRPIANPNNATEIIHVTFDVDLLLGIVTFVYAIIALLMVPYLTYESVPFLIQHNRERKALENLIKLRRESTDTWPVRNDFDELRLMVLEDYRTPGVNRNIFTNGNWRPLLIIFAVRLLSLLASNLAFQLIATIFVKVVLMSQDHGLQYSMMILLGTRIGIGIIPMLLCDRFGRKYFLFASGILCGLFLIMLAILIYLDNYEIIELLTWIPGMLFLCVYVFASIGIDCIGNVFTAEAFPLAKKAWSIGLILVIEYALQCVFLVWIILVKFKYEYMIGFILFSGIGILLISIWLQYALPETRSMSLRQCRDEFNKSMASVTYTGNRNGRRTLEGITYSS